MRMLVQPYGSGNQAMFYSQSGSLGPVGSPQFQDTGTDVLPSCRWTDHEPFGNLLITQSFDDQRQNIQFPPAQILPRF